jgi:uncharacterized protein GlcG (DUF336 family)
MVAARTEAARVGKPVSVAIVDAQGHWVLCERIDGPAPFTAFFAEGKACASVLLGRDSVDVQSMVEHLPSINAALSDRLSGRFVPLQGAVVLRDGVLVVGAIGVSGASSAEDEQIARAAALAFADESVGPGVALAPSA